MVKVKPFKDKKCKECSIMFTPKKSIQTYCSHKCANSAGNRKRSQKMAVTRNCKSCGQEFTRRPSDVKIYGTYQGKVRGAHCSHKCFRESTQSVSSLKKRVWNAFSIYIRNRDNWTCYTCGKIAYGKSMHAGHYVSRRYSATLFDEKNVHAQCSKCNTFYSGELHLYTERMIEDYGVEFVQDLIRRSKETKKFTIDELKELYEKYSLLNKQTQLDKVDAT